MVFWSFAAASLMLAAQPRPDLDVPIAIQVPAFLKALGYERALEPDGSAFVVGVVFDPADASSSAARDRILDVQRELTRLRIKGKPVVLEPVPYARDATFDGVAVILVTPLPPDVVDRVSARARAEGVVTLAMAPEDVERGLVLGMESREGKPRFVVNLAAAEAAGASFESTFLDLCRVVER